MVDTHVSLLAIPRPRVSCRSSHTPTAAAIRNVDRYSGEYFGDKIHGFGVYHFANGHSYEGSWHEGQKQGFGMYTFRNGDKRGGEWDVGILKNPQPPSDPAVQHVVQTARKVADNAVHISPAEEQVSKAVAAANRAATAARVAAIKVVQNRMDGKFCDTKVRGYQLQFCKPSILGTSAHFSTRNTKKIEEAIEHLQPHHC